MARAKSAKTALARVKAVRQCRDMESLPNRIREWRERRDLSLQELAAAVGCHHTYLGRVERGERRLTDAMIAKLSKALGVSANDIVKAEDQVATEQTVARMSRLLKDMSPDEQQMALELVQTLASRQARRAS